MKNLILAICGVFLLHGYLYSQGKDIPIKNLSAVSIACPMEEHHSHNTEEETVSSTMKTVCGGFADVKYVNVNYHFIQRNNGTGNFTNTSDGLGNTNYNGYLHAEAIVDRANYYMANNNECWTSPTGTAVLPIRVQYVLKGVYFHKSDDYYTVDNAAERSNWAIRDELGVNIGSEINVFSIPESYSGDGIASCINCTDNAAFKLFNGWSVYQTFPSWSTSFSGRLFNHEIGHTFSLFHTANGNDSCADTDQHNNCWTLDTNDPACDTWDEVSNNAMDYNSSNNPCMSPCQISRIHNRLGGPMSNYVGACGNCMPANSFFTLPKKRHSPSGCPPNVTLDGTGSWGEINHYIMIKQVQGNTQQFSQYYSGEIGRVDLSSYCNDYQFYPGYTYEVTLLVQDACFNWYSSVKRVRITGPSTPNSPCMNKVGNLYNLERLQFSGEDYSVKVFPNPTSASFSLELQGLTDQENLSLFLYDLNGRLLQSQVLSDNSGFSVVDVSTLGNGVYLLTVSSGSGVLFKERLVIAR